MTITRPFHGAGLLVAALALCSMCTITTPALAQDDGNDSPVISDNSGDAGSDTGDASGSGGEGETEGGGATGSDEGSAKDAPVSPKAAGEGLTQFVSAEGDDLRFQTPIGQTATGAPIYRGGAIGSDPNRAPVTLPAGPVAPGLGPDPVPAPLPPLPDPGPSIGGFTDGQILSNLDRAQMNFNLATIRGISQSIQNAWPSPFPSSPVETTLWPLVDEQQQALNELQFFQRAARDRGLVRPPVIRAPTLGN